MYSFPGRVRTAASMRKVFTPPIETLSISFWERPNLGNGTPGVIRTPGPLLRSSETGNSRNGLKLHSALYLCGFDAYLNPFRKSCRFLPTGAYPGSYVTNHDTNCISHASPLRGTGEPIASLWPAPSEAILARQRALQNARYLQAEVVCEDAQTALSACAVTAQGCMHFDTDFGPSAPQVVASSKSLPALVAIRGALNRSSIARI